jgi:hypothetical protein
MKRYGSLYPAICDPENIRCAHRNARKGKAHYRDVMRVDADPEKYLDKIRRMLKTETFENSEYSVFIRHGKKDREIFPSRIRGIDFLGYRFFGYKTLVRKRIVKDFHKKLATIRKHWRHMPAPAIVNGVMSYYGWLKHADARGLWKASIDNEIRQIMNAVCTANRIKNPLEVVL